MSKILTLHNPAVARKYYEDGLWQNDTFYTLLQKHVQSNPDDYALRDSHQRLSNKALLDWVDALAEDMHRSGVKAGERVSIWLPSCAEAVVIFLACSRNGYVCNTSLHQNYTVEEVETLLKRLRSSVLFAKPGYGADANQHDVFAAVDDLACLRRVYTLGDERRVGTEPFPPLRSDLELTAPVDTNADKVSYLAFTSGTTGAPKGVLHSDNTLLANARAMVADWQHNAETVLFVASPLSHHIGTVALTQSLVAGAELVINDVPAAHLLDRIIESQANYLMGVPTHAMDILAEIDRRKLDRLGNIKIFYMAGAPIPRQIAEQLRSLGTMPQNVYGMTENGSHQYTLPSDNADTIVATCGRACRGYEIAIWREENPNELAEPGEVGEIGGRGALLMLGYFDNQTATETSFNEHGWFMSGDLGRLDENGCLQIMGRKKDLIIRGGHNIHPANIEEIAIRHHAIEKAAVFPVPDERLGEKVCLSVISNASAPLDPQLILEFLKEKGLSKYDMPEYFCDLDKFPLTASGKILKREMVEMVKAGQLNPTPVRWVNSSKR